MSEPEKVNQVVPPPAPTPAPAPVAPPAPQVTPPEPKAEERKFTQAEMEAILKERLDREKVKREEAEHRAKEEAEKALLAKNADWEKLAKKASDELETIKRELAKRDLEAKRRTIALKVGIPESLVDRVRGETDEEIEKDAKAFLETLPKQTKPAQSPTNPGGAQQGETTAQRLARIHGRNVDVFDTEVMRKLGGGVFQSPKNPE